MNGNEQIQPGFFGKLPSKRDFVNRRVPIDFSQVWDRWLQESLAESKQQLGEEWLDIYLESPIWRFCLSKGVAGQRSWAGILIPSVDQVGRYYPLTLATPLRPGASPISTMTDGSSWFEAAEKLALWSLEDAFEIETFDQRVAQLGTPTAAKDSPTPTAQDEDERSGYINAWRFALPTTQSLDSSCPGVLNHSLNQLFFGYSIWWTTGSPHISPSFLICQALPPTSGFSALLGGSWTHWSWQDFSQQAHECNTARKSDK